MSDAMDNSDREKGYGVYSDLGIGVDTMKTVLSPGGGAEVARVHGINLIDPGSCTVGTHTLTLEEWKNQQSEE